MNKGVLNNTLLGEKVSLQDGYNPEVLFRVPREENRIQYGLKEGELPFIGIDVWTCWETSFLNMRGLPINGVLKLNYPATSKYIVESKSLKLYLGSFNMELFPFQNEDRCIKKFCEIVRKDLSTLLECRVNIQFFEKDESYVDFYNQFPNLLSLVENYNEILFDKFNESPDLLLSQGTSQNSYLYTFQTDLLRSNCRVTNQPDWGDLFVSIETKEMIDFTSILRYIISFRKENHFHEEVVEMIYKRFFDKYKPINMFVLAKYTRRGGIDINPLRYSGDYNSKTWNRSHLFNINLLHKKELRQ